MGHGDRDMLSGIGKVNRFVQWLWRRQRGYYGLTPVNLLLYLTYRCTSACKTCGMWQRPAAEQELSAQEWLDVARMFERRDIAYAELFGGDALLRKDVLFALGKTLKDQKIPKVDLTTNCNLMTPEIAGEIVRSGIDPVLISCDGPREVHDRIRGRQGSFDRLERGVAMLREARGRRSTPEIILNTTISRLNVDRFEEIFDLAIAWGVDKWTCEYVGEFPSDSLEWSRVAGRRPKPHFEQPPGQDSLLVSLEQAHLLKKKIMDLKGRAADQGLAFLTYNIDILTPLQIAAGTVPKNACHIIRTWVTVDPAGSVLPCPFFQNYSIGNLTQQSFQEVWGNRLHRDFIRMADAGELPMCRHCNLSVERNVSFGSALKRSFLRSARRG